MTNRFTLIGLLLFGISACKPSEKKDQALENETYEDVKFVGAMRNVMWKGELEGTISLDSISPKTGLYGLGPESFLTGELLIKDGVSYVSRINADSSIQIEKNGDVSAPFFVYANVKEWKEIALGSETRTIKDLEKLIDENTKDSKRPFAFKLTGKVNKAVFHIQNLPPGTKVSNPDEAHVGQQSFELQDEEVEIIGFFSSSHQGVFTHHDSFLHMHLITQDEQKMGHLDELQIGEMMLYLPKN